MIRPRELTRSLTLFPTKTPTLPPATHTNSYALGGREVVLVEPSTPYENEQRDWLLWARSLPGQGRIPKAIFATHHHRDHIGGVEVLCRELGLPLWVHEETRRRISEVPGTVTLGDGERFVLDGPSPESWTVLHTPGHAWGHLCLHHEADGTLVVGDMVASVGTILIEKGDGDMAVYLDQLRRLAGLGATLALPAHGEPIDAPTALFEKYIAHRLMREAKVLGAVRQRDVSGGTLAELLPLAYDDAPVSVWPIALLSIERHLAKLVADGAVLEENGRYRAVASS